MNLIKKNIKTIVIFFVIIIGITLVATAASMLSQYSDEVAKQAATKAQYNTLQTQKDIEFAIEEYKTKATVVANIIPTHKDHESLFRYIADLRYEKGYEDVYMIRYYKDNVLYSYNGDVFDGFDGSRTVQAQHPDHCEFVSAFEDTSNEEGTMSLIGFYCPVEESAEMDGVVVYYVRNVIERFFSAEREDMTAEFSVLCLSDGEVVVGREVIENTRLFDALRLRIGDKGPVTDVEHLLQEKKSGTVSARIGADDYIISVGANEGKMKELSLVELYKVRVLCSTGFDFIDSVIGIFIVFAFATAFIVAYLFIRRKIMEKKYYNLETVDKKLDCLNRYGFEKEIRNIIARNVTSYFAVIVFEIKHFDYITETFGGQEKEQLLSYLRMTCSKTVQMEELFGSMENGQFLLLLHAKDRAALLERLKIHAFLATQYKSLNKFDVILKYGIYEVNHEDIQEPSTMIDFALEANEAIVQASEDNATMQFNFYNDELRKIRLINNDMELRMEGALKDGEFQVFYQPKYNLNHDKQDGAEALVRWYDPNTKEYNRPALFMPLFETNGFIVKLDKYVYTKVCEYISYSIANGRPVYPVSVNVSRITAVQPDFVDYYTRIKKKYGIRDGQLMIEFTESFAYENYETLFKITEDLHRSGFKCSIDDFGSGYSSYRILKSLPMDEIKLDKFFLEKGWSSERDAHIIESILQLAKNLGMKITQEGVETIEEVNMLRAIGFDVIQGYYYSHPLPMTDYINFATNSKEHNIPKNI